ncbi:MAG: hypothetical protein U5O39_12975 [Gammaproteobacteria bacterium]|nr:hypothetical protein [Gammaproteobacteria bacterium]
MNFFEAQDESRRNTTLLVFFFLMAVISIVVLVNLLIFAVFNYSDSRAISGGSLDYSWQTFAGVAAVVVTFIGLGSLYRMWSLSGGGAQVAEMMGGQLLIEHGGDLRRRRLLNVVEEMAIASGTPVPPVYVIPDPALSTRSPAGYSPGDAVSWGNGRRD